MFQEGTQGGKEDVPYLAETLAEAIVVDDESAVVPGGRLAGILTAPLDAVNYPFRRISPVVRLGLGLGGVLLLLTLALIRLFQFLIG
jgi:hypothetical protein